MTQTVAIEKMTRKEKESFDRWEDLKKRISRIEKIKRKIEKEKKELLEVFSAAFDSGNTVIYSGKVKVIKTETPVDVEAYSYTRIDYKKG